MTLLRIMMILILARPVYYTGKKTVQTYLHKDFKLC